MSSMGIPMIHDNLSPSQAPFTNQNLATLIKQRAETETLLDACAAVLDRHNVKMSDSLVDKDGFPRSDIDVAAVRIAKASIIRLRNDYKDLTNAIEKRVHEGFGGNLGAPAAPRPTAARAVPSDRQPFATVNSVAEASPAALAGLEAGDQIVTFGPVYAQNHNDLQGLARTVAQAVDKAEAIEVTLLRTEEQGRTAFLRRVLRPNTAWGGRGAVGAHFLPLSQA